MNLLCILTHFDIQSDPLEAILRGAFGVQREKIKYPYLKIAFSTLMRFIQNREELMIWILNPKSGSRLLDPEVKKMESTSLTIVVSIRTKVLDGS